MRILLYKPDTDDAFKMYSRSCEVIIDEDARRVKIINMDFKTQTYNRMLSEYILVAKRQPVWTDDTKNNSEILVKLVVVELE